MKAMLFILFILFVPFLIFRKGSSPKAKHRFDAMLILGCPTMADGSLSSAQNRRLEAALSYLDKHVIPFVIISGAAVKNDTVEAEAMKAALQKKGVTIPIILETKARNTYQNFLFTKEQFHDLNLLVITGSAHRRRSYFFARKFFTHCMMGQAKHDPLLEYIKEYFRMWNTLYWEGKLFIQKAIFPNKQNHE